ncbi:MAG: glutamyl-tRNA amidotransferase [Acidiferrobacteraceae bacterium]|nr:glutamyl-tRNA amidotransferase [Acidiferrobacteraceae bacterium]
MSLREQISTDIKQSMRSKDNARLETLRLLKAAIQKREIDEHAELSDSDVLSVIQKMIKQGHDAIEQFKKGNREDLVNKELAMVRILESYTPQPLEEGQLKKLIDEIIEDTKALSVKDMGKVMNQVKEKAAGRADMSVVSSLVKNKLK